MAHGACDSDRKAADGFGDWPLLLVKQRLANADEAHADHIFGAFFGVQAPLGAAAFTNPAWVITPTLAAREGWGQFESRRRSARVGF
jgi:hypothetical protein